MSKQNAEVASIPVMKSVEGHHAAVPFYVCSDMFGGVPFEIAGGDISRLAGVPVADTHQHSIDEIYLLVSAEPGDATIEVEIEGIKHKHISPSVIHIPAGKKHRFITKEAKPGSFCFGILYEGHANNE